MPMKADLWFPTVIWNDELKQINNSELKEYVVKLKAQDEKGKVASNYGGWQSQSFEILDERPIAIERFIQTVQKSINECTKMSGLMGGQRTWLEQKKVRKSITSRHSGFCCWYSSGSWPTGPSVCVK